MPNAFQRRVLAERTAALAERGVATDSHLLPPRLVCLAGGRHVGLPMSLVGSIRPFSCQPVPLVAPRAAGIMLGLSLFGHRLVSVLDLGQLLSGGEPVADPVVGGSMILLRASGIAVAVRVEQVLGVMRLRPAADHDRALLPADDRASDPPQMVALLTADALVASIASLDNG